MISTINYCETIFEHPELSKIIGVLKYETLHLLHNGIQSNAMAVHSNLEGGQHSYLGLVVIPDAYDVLTNTPFFFQVHPVNLVIPISSNRHVQEELKRQYDKNLTVFHETGGVEGSLIQKLVLSVESRHITAIRNRTTVQFTGNLFILIPYLIVIYG